MNGHADPLPRATARRVAVYTRVSTDEQAILEFNSLQAQEQICKTYVSMRSDDPAAKEKWVASETYTDSGYSGGTLERPGLMRLMTDIEARRIDTIIVYKVDRLSRSIHQFYRIWEVLQHYGVDLISATQDLNTSTSQGKLMLNMLLSFGQFEREQISERTRDKVAAARKRGRWTGGMPILGYDIDPRGGRLTVNEDEAPMVREIFKLYETMTSLTKVVEELGRRGWRRKTWTLKSGLVRKGAAFDKPGLLHLLRNPLYCGKVSHRGTFYPGEHSAIIDYDAWAHVQVQLNRNGSAGYQGERSNSEALLKGLLRCAHCGRAMTPSYAVKGARRYCYYVCQSRLKQGAHACPAGRVAAKEVEQRVVEQLRAIGRDPELTAETVRQARVQLQERRTSLAAERRELAKDLGRRRASMKRLLGRNSGTGDLAGKLAEVQGKIQASEGRIAAIDRELAATKGQDVDEREVAMAFEAFGPVWEALLTTERARILGHLTEGIAYDGRDGRTVVMLRPGGIAVDATSETS